MAKQMKQDTPPVPRKRRLAALTAAARCGGEKRDTLHSRVHGAGPEALRLTRRTRPGRLPRRIAGGVCPFRTFSVPSSTGTPQ